MLFICLTADKVKHFDWWAGDLEKVTEQGLFVWVQIQNLEIHYCYFIQY